MLTLGSQNCNILTYNIRSGKFFQTVISRLISNRYGYEDKVGVGVCVGCMREKKGLGWRLRKKQYKEA